VKEPRSLTNRAQYKLVYQRMAVQRNRLKRLLREIMRLQSLKSGWDIVLIARPAAVNVDYHQLEETVTKLLARAELLESNE